MVLYCERALNFLSVLRGTNSETKLNSVDFQISKKTLRLLSTAAAQNSCKKFSAQYSLKGIAKASAVDLLRLITLGGTKAAFLSPKRDHVPPGPFSYETPPVFVHQQLIKTIIKIPFSKKT